ncbi:MAG: hypothetical protein ACREQ7_07640 [Candidatus Binatia bacterium]
MLTGKSFGAFATVRQGNWLIIGGVAGVLLFQPTLHAQSSPLTVQPSTGRVGIGNTNPAYPLDVNGAVNATSFRGDGSQLTNLPGGASNTVIDEVTADTTVGNTSAETAVYTFTVPANTLGTNNRLRLLIEGEEKCGNCTEDFFYFRLKFGGTTLFNSTVAPAGGVLPFKAEFLINADGSANSQRGLLFYIGNGVSRGQGTAAVDSTAAQILQVTVDWTTAGTNKTMTLKHAVLELVN